MIKLHTPSLPKVIMTNNLRFKHLRNAAEQKDLIASGKGSVHGTAEWVWSGDPVNGWDQAPVVPSIYADAGVPS